MSTSLSSLLTLLPAASVVVVGVLAGFVLGRGDNRAERFPGR
jgi:hypothetical protein